MNLNLLASFYSVNELALCRPTADVNEQDVVYRLGDDAVCDTSDSFSFSVVDRGEYDQDSSSSLYADTYGTFTSFLNIGDCV